MLDVLNQQALAAGYVDLSTEFEVVCGTDRKRKQFVTDPVVACNIKALLMHNMEVRAMYRMHRMHVPTLWTRLMSGLRTMSGCRR